MRAYIEALSVQLWIINLKKIQGLLDNWYINSVLQETIDVFVSGSVLIQFNLFQYNTEPLIRVQPEPEAQMAW